MIKLEFSAADRNGLGQANLAGGLLKGINEMVAEKEKYLGFVTNRDVKQYNNAHAVDFVELINRLELQQGTVVDIGCGQGQFLYELKTLFPQIKAIGVDAVVRDGALVAILPADARNLPLENGCADIAVCTHVSQHITSGRDKFYQEFARIISPRGLGFVFPVKREDIPSSIPSEDYAVNQKKMNFGIFYRAIFGNHRLVA